MASAYPEYVTDGSHIYLWHEEYASMLEQGKLKACDPPPPVVKATLTTEEKEEIEKIRKKALHDAELAIKMYGPAAQANTKMEEIFGSPPQD